METDADSQPAVASDGSGQKRKRRIGERPPQPAADADIDANADADPDVEMRPPAAKRSRPFVEKRSVVIPPNRRTPLRQQWPELCRILVDQLSLQCRCLTRRPAWTVELRNSPLTKDDGHLQKGADLIDAFVKGFQLGDALALVRLDDLYVDSFTVADVKPSLKGDHVSRAIGRVAGKNGRTKFMIENATKTRIVVADHTVHILGAYDNVQAAKRTVCDLILGSPPSKVYGNMHARASKAAAKW